MRFSVVPSIMKETPSSHDQKTTPAEYGSVRVLKDSRRVFACGLDSGDSCRRQKEMTQ